MGLRRINFHTCSEDETIEFGRRLGASLLPPVWIGLEGDLGAGKTRLAQGVAQGLGYAGRVRSPTFVLENRYRARIPILHQDLYRLDRPGEDFLCGWDEHPGVVLVEWAQRAESNPIRWIRIRLTESGPDERDLEVSWDPAHDVLLADWLGLVAPSTGRPRDPGGPPS